MTDGTYVHLQSRPVGWGTPFRLEGYTLPFRNTQSTPFRRNLIVRYLEITPFDFFNFVSQFGPVYRAAWKREYVMVAFLSNEHTDQCFNEVVEKGYTAAIVCGRCSIQRGALGIKSDLGDICTLSATTIRPSEY